MPVEGLAWTDDAAFRWPRFATLRHLPRTVLWSRGGTLQGGELEEIIERSAAKHFRGCIIDGMANKKTESVLLALGTAGPMIRQSPLETGEELR